MAQWTAYRSSASIIPLKFLQNLTGVQAIWVRTDGDNMTVRAKNNTSLPEGGDMNIY